MNKQNCKEVTMRVFPILKRSVLTGKTSKSHRPLHEPRSVGPTATFRPKTAKKEQCGAENAQPLAHPIKACSGFAALPFFPAQPDRTRSQTYQPARASEEVPAAPRPGAAASSRSRRSDAGLSPHSVTPAAPPALLRGGCSSSRASHPLQDASLQA